MTVSTRFVISPYKPPNAEMKPSLLKIDLAEFQRRFSEAWREARVSSTETSVIWVVDEGSFLGALFPDSQAVTFGAIHLSSCIDFVLWYRSFVDEAFDLYLLYSEHISGSLKLTPAIQRNDIEKFIRGDSDT